MLEAKGYLLSYQSGLGRARIILCHVATYTVMVLLRTELNGSYFQKANAKMGP